MFRRFHGEFWAIPGNPHASLMFLHVIFFRELRVRPPGIEWKTGRNPKMGKNWPKIENGPRPEMGKKWPKKAK